MSSDEIIRSHLDRLLSARAFPRTICPSEVARSVSQEEHVTIGSESWRELMPHVQEMAWAMRDRDEVEILQHGEVIRHDLQREDIRGPIRIRRIRSHRQD
ncbi:hypothetical protein K490DRAFT_32325 [Saccharata proteae CBS 121410]|uniref:S-adenosylmethionine tRNA ribosyltransferase n=1 Tax=Saccharata proteae CBS 121410 TaxID=1314787 RepID=A0A9P4M1Z6_9PEZI|nr:hypothetical protein K490DRAFT_32325 [Saccharata proteae CBS 121410]